MEQPKKKHGPLVLGIVFIILSLIIFGSAIHTIIRLNDDSFTKVKGTIINYESDMINGRIQYYPVYEYELNGETRTHRSLSSTQSTNDEGLTTTLYYDNVNGRVESMDGILYVVSAGLAFLTIGVFKIIIFDRKIIKAASDVSS